MSGKSRGTSKIAAAIVIFINIITMMVCMIVFALSLWIISSPSSLINTLRDCSNSTMKALFTEESLSLQLGVAGAFLSGFYFCISFMGLYGAISGSQFLLFMYATLLVLLLLLECSVMYYFTSNLIEKGIQPQDIQLNHVLRSTLQCCERNYSLAWTLREAILYSALYTSYNIVVLLTLTALSLSSGYLTIGAPIWRNSKETLNRYSHFTKPRTH